VERFRQLIADGKDLCKDIENSGLKVKNPARLTRWTTSSLNLLDSLSAHTNRFVIEFDRYCRPDASRTVIVGLALGVLESAAEEYQLGRAVDYHLSVIGTVFAGLLHQARYLIEKDFYRAAAVLAGAGLEEALRGRALAASVSIDDKATLIPIVHALKKHSPDVLPDLDARYIESVVTKIRNDAAHGGEFGHSGKDVEAMLEWIETFTSRLLERR